MDIRKVKKLIEMLEESEISEIEIHEGEESVRISRNSSTVGPVQTVVQVPSREAGPTPVSEEASSSDGREPVRELEGNYIPSPMVGIFYSGPAPDKPPFVEHGSSVKKGDIVCIIEAMKIMNQIESELDGVISRVMVENGDPVEFGQPLFLIREA
jgi:acetyl-CoA carboxylase biotin carboxyl carrier protein